jgi:transcriptional regulator with GAF, ATPase, and Fis domain
MKLRPLRERREDVPQSPLVLPILCYYSVEVSLPRCQRCLSNYLWFGNLNEMETVIARTLALQRKLDRSRRSDFDFSVAGELPDARLRSWFVQRPKKKRAQKAESRPDATAVTARRENSAQRED